MACPSSWTWAHNQKKRCSKRFYFFATYMTFEWLFSGVNFVMVCERTKLTELFFADSTLERLFSADSHCDCTT